MTAWMDAQLVTEWERTKTLTADLPWIFPLQAGLCIPTALKIGVQDGNGHSDIATPKT